MSAIGWNDEFSRQIRQVLSQIHRKTQGKSGGAHSKKKFLVAVSGGADSVALLHLLLEAGFSNLVVAHFNHRLRGNASRADAAFVERLAAKLSLPVESGSRNVRRLAREQKLSVETTARHARYAFLASAAKKHRIRSVLLAHHADDQVETCLFHFLRGSGAAGLAGMKPHSRRTIEGITLEIHRPLLAITKQQLIGYLKERKIRYREDSTNSVADASRNKLRLKLLPLIEKLFGSSFRGAIVRNARIFADEEEFLAGEALPFVPAIPKVQGTRRVKTDFPELSVKILRQLHPALRRRVLHSWLKNCGVLEPGFAEVERLTSLLDHDDAGKGPSKINLPGNLHARRRAGVIFLER